MFPDVDRFDNGAFKAHVVNHSVTTRRADNRVTTHTHTHTLTLTQRHRESFFKFIYFFIVPQTLAGSRACREAPTRV